MGNETIFCWHVWLYSWNSVRNDDDGGFGVVVQITMIVTPSKDVDADLLAMESVPMIVDLELDVEKKLRKVEAEHVTGEMTRTKHARRKGPS